MFYFRLAAACLLSVSFALFLYWTTDLPDWQQRILIVLVGLSIGVLSCAPTVKVHLRIGPSDDDRS